MKTVDPVASQLPTILASLPQNKPLVMVNLLRFRDRAQYQDAAFDCSGREAYARYATVAASKMAEVGGKPFFIGACAACVIAPPDEIWHEVLLVRYPSAKAFIAMLAMPDYRAATVHRTAALEDARLIASVEPR
ncbi:MAG: DUF1330 domain-containing protein [Gammaproteobacteria bacterium]|nr:DUF1330 domain-containing protein [Gammaproteobacteria bacterium]